jgi:hypothetical protein
MLCPICFSLCAVFIQRESLCAAAHDIKSLFKLFNVVVPAICTLSDIFPLRLAGLPI